MVKSGYFCYQWKCLNFLFKTRWNTHANGLTGQLMFWNQPRFDLKTVLWDIVIIVFLIIKSEGTKTWSQAIHLIKEKQQCHTVGIVQKSNRKIIGKIDTYKTPTKYHSFTVLAWYRHFNTNKYNINIVVLLKQYVISIMYPFDHAFLGCVIHIHSEQYVRLQLFT
jgi:hypothetical protein